MGKVIKIREVGDPVLNKKSEKVENVQEVKELIDDLKTTLEFGAGFGIAAPQIGVLKRVIVIRCNKEDSSYNDTEDIPLTAMINVEYKPKSRKTSIEFEGCMSVPSIRGKVKRYKDITLFYIDEDGNKVKKDVSGFFARLIQHECDHLDGIIFLDKVEKPNGFSTLENIKKYDLKKM